MGVGRSVSTMTLPTDEASMSLVVARESVGVMLDGVTVSVANGEESVSSSGGVEITTLAICITLVVAHTSGGGYGVDQGTSCRQTPVTGAEGVMIIASKVETGST